MVTNYFFAVRCLLLLGVCSGNVAHSCFAQQRPNVLFIPIDDLRPETSNYGNTIIHTPNIQKLADNGVTFDRAYCQQAVCNPSRASLLTGLTPDVLRVWDLRTNLRDSMPDVVTLPQYFKQHGYYTVGLGKAFHNIFPDSLSWSEAPELRQFPFDPDAVYLNEENIAIQQDRIAAMKANGRSSIDRYGHWYVKANATEAAEATDDAYFDGFQTTTAIAMLSRLKSAEQPFFLSVGYYRPHLPFNAPKKYWDLYDPTHLPVAGNPFPPKGSPAYAVHGDLELRSYADQRDLPLPGDPPLALTRQQHLLHGYYASVSYIDAQIGRLIQALDSLGLSQNTIIVLWGDHGWKLGEHNGWCKQTNYEIDTRVPLIVSGAGVVAKGSHTRVLTEFIDIYPSLAEMAGLDIPPSCMGTSFVPQLTNPNAKGKTGAYSQFLLGRFGKVERIKEEMMGYAVTDGRYRYVEWYQWNKETSKPGALLDKELFDHMTDPDENINIAEETRMEENLERLHKLLRQRFGAIPIVAQ